MSTALAAAIHAQGAQPAIDPRQRLEDRERAARARALSYPRARAVLAWCDRHPQQVRGREHLVSALREAIACDQFVARPLVALWAELPASIHATCLEAPG